MAAVCLTRGHIDFNVLAYRRDLKQDYSGFNINIIVDEGKKYKINNILIKNNLSNINLDRLYDDLILEKGDFFDQRDANLDISTLNEFFGKKGFSFIEIDLLFENKDKLKGIVDIIFNNICCC